MDIHRGFSVPSIQRPCVSQPPQICLCLVVLCKRPAFEFLPVPPLQRLPACGTYHPPLFSTLGHAVEIDRLSLFIAQLRHTVHPFSPSSR